MLKFFTRRLSAVVLSSVLLLGAIVGYPEFARAIALNGSGQLAFSQPQASFSEISGLLAEAAVLADDPVVDQAAAAADAQVAEDAAAEAVKAEAKKLKGR